MDAFSLMLCFTAGLAAGAIYFAALWLTIGWFTRQSASPAWLLLGTAIRLALLIGALYWITDGQVERLLAALAGFFLVRFIALRWSRTAGRPHRSATIVSAASENSDAADAR